MKDLILNKIQNLKNKPFKDMTIDCVFGDLTYKLVFLTSDVRENDHIIQLLSDWRKKHETWFAAQFEVTSERTKKWFEERVIGVSDRLLFMIEVNGEYIGHVGLFRFDFNNSVCDIDNIVRGVDEYPGIIGSAINHMMEWGKKEFALQGYTLETTSDNKKALKLYEKMGFKEIKRIPLMKTDENNFVEWVDAPQGYKGEIERYNVFMILKYRNLKISTIAHSMSQSEIRNMSIECDNVGGINLAQGVCDLPLPKEVEDGAIAAIKNGVNTYTRYDGLDELREAIVVKTKKYNNISITADKNIVVSAGTTGALYVSLLALIEPGDEVIVFEPYYGYHINTLVAIGAVPKYVKLVPPEWDFNMKELEKIVTEKTKAILINTPSNPVGKVFSLSELKKIANFSIKNDLFIFSDEIYEYFVYDGLKHISPASIPEIFDRTITISGYSKTFSTTGWRVGYCICHEKWKETIGFVNDVIYVCAPAPLQMGIASGIANIRDEFYDSLRLKYQNKRDNMCKALSSIGLTPHIPKGAYYVMADVSSLPGKNSKEKAMYILQKIGVATVPGSAFYHDDGGEKMVRFCFAKDDNVLESAIEQFKKL